MAEKYTYLLVDFFCIIFPFLFSFHPQLQFFKNWRAFIWPCLLTAAFFLIWDGIFTHIGVWSFNPHYVMGIYFWDMPIEEFLFFICIPYACVFSYHCFKVLFKFQRYQTFARVFYAVTATVLMIIALLHLTQLYTSVTFILCAVFLFYLVYKNEAILSTFFFCFLFILVPFILSNGVLTGSFFGRIVVQYNDAHNLGIRILTIPVEDTFYGMLMLMLNVWGYERNLKTVK
ncbi:MAG: lycopene cyclase domain-containing protein [Bacteroidota bacterium]